MDTTMMFGLLARIFSTILANMCFGASVYINTVETPARVSLKTCEAIITNFQAVFPIAAKVQPRFGMAAMMFGLVGWYTDSDEASWLILCAQAAIFSITVLTITVIMPVNYQLVGRDFSNPIQSAKKQGDKWALDMVLKWDKYHAIRSLLSGISVLIWWVYWLNQVHKFI